MPKRRAPSSSRARGRAPARLLCCALAALAFMWSGRAEAVTVALLRPAAAAPALEEAMFRLQGELLALGASVAITDGPTAPDSNSAEVRAWLERAARARGVDAFIAVVGDDEPVGADVWICERSHPRLRLSRVVLEATTDDRAATLAIRTIEVLRSSFVTLELDRHDRTLPQAASPEPVLIAATPRAPARLGFEAGATALAGFGAVGPALLPLVQVDWALGSWLSLQATAAGFGTRPRVETAAGGVGVAREFALFGLCFCAPVRTGIQPVLTLSSGALHTTLTAEANVPNLGHRAARWALLVDAGAGARVGLPARLYVTMAGHLELAEPYVAVHVLDSVVATTGRPNVLFTLTIGARP